MIKVKENEAIRYACFVDGWSIRKISREMHHCRQTIRKALQHAEPLTYTLRKPRAPVLIPYAVHAVGKIYD